MFREIRRKERAIDMEATKALLKNERRAVLSVNGDDGYPYGVPINFVYCEEEGKVYFHSSRKGHKVDSIKRDDKACLTVYGNVSIGDVEWAPYVQSAIAFGRCKLVEDQDKGIELVRKLAAKYYPNAEEIDMEVNKDGHAVQMIEMTIEHLSGKQIQER